MTKTPKKVENNHPDVMAGWSEAECIAAFATIYDSEQPKAEVDRRVETLRRRLVKAGWDDGYAEKFVRSAIYHSKFSQYVVNGWDAAPAPPAEESQAEQPATMPISEIVAQLEILKPKPADPRGLRGGTGS